MAAYLMDTNAVKAAMLRQPRMLDYLSSLSTSDRIVTCWIVRGEVRYGLERLEDGHRKRNLEKAAKEVFLGIPCEHASDTIADYYGRLKRETERKGTSLADNDLWIAATALALDATLLTSDSDFQRVSGLRVENWE